MRPPKPTMKRYRGRPAHAMRSALKHLHIIQNWDNYYRGKPLTNYPNQLAPDLSAVTNAALQISVWLQQLGPIPSR